MCNPILLSALCQTIQPSVIPAALHFSDQPITGIACRPQAIHPDQANLLYVVIDEFLQYGHWTIGADLPIPDTQIAALVVEHPLQNAPPAIPQIIVKNSRQALAQLAKQFYQQPDEHLEIIGITGTNGKTTTAHLINQWLNLNGIAAAALGTLGLYQFRQPMADLGYTTPLSPDLFALLATLPAQKITHLAMEISSHALKLDRVWGLRLNTAVLTQLTRDHLDFHQTESDYAASKRRLFSADFLKPATTLAILNQEDALGRALIAELQAKNQPYLSYGRSATPHLLASKIQSNLNGNRFQCHYQQTQHDFQVPLLGAFNIDNTLAAIAACLNQGLTLEQLQQTAAQLRGVPGRMETFPLRNGALGVVDYAHTPDALEKALQTLRHLKPRRIITLFGCGGDRDRGKRPQMGAIAARYSDRVIVTQDNPRREDPQQITQDILLGMPSLKPLVIDDRYTAIQTGFQLAQAGDVLLVAGKGHETEQIIGDVRYPFSDRAILAQFQ